MWLVSKRIMAFAWCKAAKRAMLSSDFCALPMMRGVGLNSFPFLPPVVFMANWVSLSSLPFFIVVLLRVLRTARCCCARVCALPRRRYTCGTPAAQVRGRRRRAWSIRRQRSKQP